MWLGKGHYETVLLSEGVVSFACMKSLLCPSKCQEEAELLFSLEVYAAFEISDTRTFVFINSIDCLLLSVNTGLSI